MKLVGREATAKANVSSAEQERLPSAKLTGRLRGKVGVKGTAANFDEWLLEGDSQSRLAGDVLELRRNPFPNVADQLIETVGSRAGRVLVDGNGLSCPAVPKVGLLRVERVPPRVFQRECSTVSTAAPTGSVFPLGGTSGVACRTTLYRLGPQTS